MKYSFEKLEVWNDSRQLTKHVYKITKSFPDDEKFGIINQMRRCSISICSNIVEGSYRTTGKEKYHFMTIAYSSLMELMNQSIISTDLGYMADVELSEIRDRIEKISNKLNSLSEYFKKLK